MSVPTQSDARDRIMLTAASLFYKSGIRTIGVDAIIRESEVAKMTFYKHFKSKDQLIVEYLRVRDRQWWDWIDAALKRYKQNDLKRPLVIFDALERRLQRPFDRGCAFLNAITELADANHPAYQFALGHKREVETFVRKICQEAGYQNTNRLAAQLVLLLEGALATAQRQGVSEPAQTAKKMAGTLLSNSDRKDKSTVRPKKVGRVCPDSPVERIRL